MCYPPFFHITGKLRVLHCLYGQEILDILKDIQTFLDDHLQEVVILDFQHFFQCSDADHAFLINQIQTIFGPGKLLKQSSAFSTQIVYGLMDFVLVHGLIP